MICHTTDNPAPSISAARGRGRKLLLASLSPSLYAGGATQPWIRLVALADMWTDSCQQHELNQSARQARASLLPLGCP